MVLSHNHQTWMLNEKKTLLEKHWESHRIVTTFLEEYDENHTTD